MSGLTGLTIPEKIVWLFEHRVSEAHRSSIEEAFEISAEQFDRAIPTARDLGSERGLRFTPLYERDGWWTAYPTRRIAARAVHEAVTRNLHEAARNARVYKSFGKIERGADFAEAALHGARSVIEGELPELHISSSSDYIVSRVDLAIEARSGYVFLEAQLELEEAA